MHNRIQKNASGRIALGIGAAAGFALLLSGCAGGASGGDASQKLTVSHFSTPIEGWPLDVLSAANLASQMGCTEFLTHYDEESGELEPLLATEWSQVEPTTWEFKLREGVTFQDGSALDAAAVANSLNHLLERANPSPAFLPSAISGVEAVDEHTVHITTPEESALVPLRVASPSTAILSEAAYNEDSIDMVDACTGPYAVAEQQAGGEVILLEANPDYWGEAPAVSEVEMRFYPDGNTRATQVRTGESQIAIQVPPSTFSELESSDEATVARATTPRTTGLYFNTSKAPFDNPEVRRAVQLALDIDPIVTSIYEGIGAPAVGPFAPGNPWAPEGAEPMQADPEAAKTLLAEAGVEEGSIRVGLISYTERPEYGDLAAVIQEQLKEIGIEVDIREGDYASVEPDMLSGNFDMTLLSRNQMQSVVDPGVYLVSDYTCEGSFNISQYCDPALDEMIDAAAGLMEPEERYAAYADVAERLQEEAITVFLVHEELLSATHVGLEGFIADPYNRYAVTTDLRFE